ncbi:MAG: Cof-type HAD-IIB family hydrolase [Peptococcia bacterium]|jgi:Cof subfamily protein (haloacid dehalogenase superfamily)
MEKIKLIAIDLDDTLLHDDLTISARAKKDIREVIAQGITVTLATGRMFAAALPYARELELDVPLITYQGAMVKYVNGRIIHHQTLPLEVAQKVIDLVRPYGYHVNIYVDDELFMEQDSPEGRHYVSITKVPPKYVDVGSFDQLWAEPTKLVILAEDEKLKLLAKELNQKFKGMLNINRTLPCLLEMTHYQADKGNALKALAESLDLQAENVMAIGDSPNDVEMIKYAGFSVAMENAIPQLKEQVDYVTLSNNDDGVAEVLEKFVLTV